ncbi:hypothetical protein RSOLAG1IB_09707 [Rhizoctonia solani AG-1 IB]|uniref:Uncharacterized protein n=1 Tax=Thanatephorus cucumeris (strain AG1-IB / isolate 7/3/14) TaxID=1108050 RepID=A0A0B7FS68_THACB|nr:hypothetical protein RSOLAG1IB_09707 [Rhizoctonia solani AG-1 IB]
MIVSSNEASNKATDNNGTRSDGNMQTSKTIPENIDLANKPAEWLHVCPCFLGFGYPQLNHCSFVNTQFCRLLNIDRR